MVPDAPAPITDIELLTHHIRQMASSLKTELTACIQSQAVSSHARILAQDVFEKSSNALDQTMYAAWYHRIRPHLNKLPKKSGYFPAAEDELSYKSTLGQWGCSDFSEIDAEFDTILREYQPFCRPHAHWIKVLKELSRLKHIRMVRQEIRIDNRMFISGPMTGGILGGPPVDYGKGIMISADEKKFQSGITQQNQTWVSFIIEGTRIEALGFSELAARETSSVVRAFRDRLKLP